ncbi:MAG: DUF192 domain-containing protein [Candidatus Korobacteraceae bacterium]
MSATSVRAANITKNRVLGDRIVVAETNLSRMIGLLGKSGLEAGEGLLIYPSQSIHTVAMRFTIDVIFADRDWRVTHLHPRMVPYRMTALHWRARCAIELPAGMIAETSTSVGDQLSVTEVD